VRMMKSVLKSRPDKQEIEVVNVPYPNLRKGWVIIKVKACGICSEGT
jgi:D-arabinose 1-dehydrogenase-like Zn-dependent alcohol dehydrogenase